MSVVGTVPVTKEGKKRPILAAVALATAAAAIIVWRLAQPPTLEQAARNTLTAFESGKGEVAIKYLHPDEVSALQLTSEKLELVFKKLQDSLPASANYQGASIDVTKTTGMYEISKTLPINNGKSMELALMAVSTDQGPKVLSLIYSLFMYGVTENFPQDPAERKGVSKIKHTLESFPRVAEIFKSSGINGIYLADPTESRTLTWDEYFTLLNGKFIEGQRREKVQVPEKANPKE